MPAMTVADARLALNERLAELDRLDRLSAEGREPVTLQQDSVGRLSRMDAMQQQAMAQAEGRRRQAERARIAAAIARLEEGEWGFCMTCGETIAQGRLANDPAVANCIGCASANQ
ncbi:transcriptional regulator TraR/DksA family protein [Aurantiacibacter atlanticus]|uniref:Transcriptional regulator TraR/DksA family protein n=2 Tax=Aurantiacibacter atlanticus TaxID=1648404 RepID=A0A0H4V8Z7_9SPHN|nr:transcriptional regulator TraR/DksA family protein [Aurantiacibacter atlanticus]